MQTSEESKSKASPTNLLGVVKTLFKWRKELVTICGIAGIGGIIIALLLPVYYASTTLFLPVSPDQATPEILFGDGGIAPEFYGNENDIDRLLTIAESYEVVDFLVDSFRLFEHYDIDVSTSRGQYAIRKQFSGLYEVIKTKRDAISITMEDKDPEMAAAIANAARGRINALTQNLIKAGQQRSISTFENDIASKSIQLKVMTDTLEQLRNRYGIFNSEAQSESLTDQASRTEARMIKTQAKLEAFKSRGSRFRDSVLVYEVALEGVQKEDEQLTAKLRKFNEGLAEVLTYTRQYQEANKSLSEDKEKLKQYQAIYTSDIPALIIVEQATEPLIKSRPFRTLIVIGTVLIAFVFTVIGILLLESYRDTDWKKLLND